MNINEVTKAFPAFRGGKDGMLRDLIAVSRRQSVLDGSQIYHEGDACSGIAFVLSAIYACTRSGSTAGR
jgi:hypothetical protein